MRHAPRFAAIFILALSTLAAAAQIKDDAGFFSRDVVAKADAKLVELKDKYRHNVAVETYSELPVELRGKVDGNEASAKQAYNTFNAMRANALGADVYVLIVRNPTKLEVAAANDVKRSGLTATGRDGLRQELLTGFRAKRYDEALTGMTASLERTYANLTARGGDATPSATPGAVERPTNSARTPTTPTPAPPVDKKSGLFANMGCIGFVVIAVVVILVISLIRKMFGGNRNAGYNGQTPPPGYGQGNYGAGGYGGGYPPQGGGGGFGRGIAGGLLGGLFGSWLGGNVFGQGHQSSGDTSGQNTGAGYGGGNDTGNSGGDATGFSTSGGDYGDNSGGSNDAGSDFSSSGGDFGGGDSGGGDSGGGGGDF